jgi:glutamine amidotransferase
MCELFGVSSFEKVPVDHLLQTFFSHSVRHPNGWGMAIFRHGSVNLEKEPVAAYRSAYLRERLQHPLAVRNMIAHIRLATVGTMDYENSHPFVQWDRSGRCWTLAHNGTIFDAPALNPYVYTQEGHTDSERILCYIVAQIDAAQYDAGRPLNTRERFAVVDRVVCELAPHNKLNLMLYDGELLYVHTNYADSLYVKQSERTALFSTVPLDSKGRWRPLPFTTLCAYQNGKECLRGTNHGFEYIPDPDDTHYLFADYAAL